MRNTFAGINTTHSGRKLAICGISKGNALDGLLGSSRGSQTYGETEATGERERDSQGTEEAVAVAAAVAVACSLCVSNPSTSSTNSHVSVRCDAVAARSSSARASPLAPSPLAS